MNKFISSDELEQMFDNCLDETQSVKIGSLEYETSRVFKLIDPIAYTQDLHAYADSLCEDGYIVEGYNDMEDN